MGKGEDLCGGTPHQCVHCLSTETPLWRSGPDGPKTLCNACGVRYKKGKLALFKGKNGNLTAVQSENSLPVVVPPLTKKAAKKAVLQKSQSAAAQESKKVARKALPDSPIGDVVAKKPRVRARRANAGQLPGRYASKSLPDDFSHWRSACASPSTGPSSPSASPERGKLSSFLPEIFCDSDWQNIFLTQLCIYTHFVSAWQMTVASAF